MGNSLKRHLLERQRYMSHVRRDVVFAHWHNAGCAAIEASWRSVAVTCRGSSHFKTGTPCQDRVFFEDFDNGAHVIALADGAGSAQLSHYGAYLTSAKAAAIVAERFDEAFRASTNAEFGTNLVGYLQHSLVALSKVGVNLDASERELFGLHERERQLLIPCRVRDLASTLLLVAVKGERYVVAHLGDGVVGIEIERSGRRSTKVLSAPDNGEFSNETVFTTSGDADKRIRVYTGRLDGLTGSVSGFVLMSDGPEQALYQKRMRSLVPACGKLLDACRVMDSQDAEDQLGSALQNVIAKKTSDDCSMAFLVR